MTPHHLATISSNCSIIRCNSSGNVIKSIGNALNAEEGSHWSLALEPSSSDSTAIQLSALANKTKNGYMPVVSSEYEDVLIQVESFGEESNAAYQITAFKVGNNDATGNSDLHVAITAYNQQNASFCLVLLDHEDLFGLNTRHGFDKTNNYLATIYEILKEETYKQLDDSLALQLHGGRFAVLTTSSSAPILKRCLKTVNSALKRHFSYAAALNTSVVRYPGNADTIDNLLLMSELLLKDVKDNQVSRICIAKPGEMLLLDNTKAEIEEALAHSQFTLRYQPIVDQHGAVCYLEALARWEHPVRGTCPPAFFIEQIARYRLMADFGWYVLERAIKEFKQILNASGTPGLKVSVNASPMQLLETDFCAKLTDICQREEFEPTKLQIEITEDSAYTVNICNQIKALKTAGFLVAIDDFGTGFSNITHLKTLQFDHMKIDKSILWQVNPNSAADIRFMRSIVELCQSLSSSVILEGIEDEDQVALCQKLEIPLHQGFYYSKPQTKDDIITYLTGTTA